MRLIEELRVPVVAGVFAAAASGCFPSFEGLTGGLLADSGTGRGDGDTQWTDDRDPGVDACGAKLDDDQRNCGRCGRDCTMNGRTPGQCAMGECQPYVFIGGADPNEIAQDYQHLFWAEKGDDAHIWMINHDGTGGKLLLASGQKNPRGLYQKTGAGGSRLYWACQGLSTGPGQFAPGTGSIASVRFSLAGVSDLRELTGENVPMYVVGDGKNLYWTAHGVDADPEAGMPDGAIRQCAPEYPCDAATTVAANQFGPTHIAYANGNLYWSTEAASLDGAKGSLWTLRVDPPAVNRLTSGVVRALWLAVDEANDMLYFSSPALGTVTRWPLGMGAGGVVPGQAAPGHIAVGNDHPYVHWINSGTAGNAFADSAVVRLPKSAFPSGTGTPPELQSFSRGEVGSDTIADHDADGPNGTEPLIYFVSPDGNIMQRVQ